MYKVIHILGASGSGTTTLGAAISKKYGHAHLDTDDYFWLPTDPPFTVRREQSERQRLLSADIAKTAKCVLSGSMCGWGDIFIPKLDLVIYVDTPTDVRVERLQKRGLARFGSRVLPGGDLYKDNIEFIEWAKSYDIGDREGRSRQMHTEWIKRLKCPIITVDGTKSTEEILGSMNL